MTSSGCEKCSKDIERLLKEIERTDKYIEQLREDNRNLIEDRRNLTNLVASLSLKNIPTTNKTITNQSSTYPQIDDLPMLQKRKKYNK